MIPFRLALIGPYPLFGHRSLEIYQRLLLERLRVRPEVEVLDWTPTSPLVGRLPRVFRPLGVAERMFLQAPLQRWRPTLDVAHATSETAGYLLGPSPAKARVATFHCTADFDFVEAETPRARLARRFRQRTHQRTIAAADVLVTISGFVRDRLQALFGPIGKPIEVVHNPCRFARDDGSVPEPSPAALAHARARRPYLFHVGSLPRKNRPRLLRAFARLPCQWDLRLVLCGALLHEEERLVGELGLGDRLVVEAAIDDDLLQAYYREAELFVFPSLYEGFGFPLIEAQCFGTPVVAGDSEGPREVAGGSCRLVDPGDVDALAAAITTLLAHPDLRRDLVTRGFANVRRFTQAAWTQGYLRAYARALDEATSGGTAAPSVVGGVSRTASSLSRRGSFVPLRGRPSCVAEVGFGG